MLRVCINTPAGPTDQRLHVSEKVLQYTLASTSDSLHYSLMGILSMKYLNSSGTSLGTNATLLFKSSYGTCNLFTYSLKVCIELFSVLKQTAVFYFSSLIFSNFHFGHLLIPSIKDWHCNKPKKSQSLVALFSVTSALIYISRFCLSETSCPQEDHFPPNLCVKVNSKPCNLPVSPDMLLLISTFFFPLHVVPVAQNHTWCALDCVRRDTCLQLRMESNQKGPAAPSTSPLSSDCPPPSPTQSWCRGPQKSGGYENRRRSAS